MHSRTAPLSRPHGRAMGCRSWNLQRNINATYREHTVWFEDRWYFSQWFISVCDTLILEARHDTVHSQLCAIVLLCHAGLKKLGALHYWDVISLVTYDISGTLLLGQSIEWTYSRKKTIAHHHHTEAKMSPFWRNVCHSALKVVNMAKLWRGRQGDTLSFQCDWSPGHQQPWYWLSSTGRSLSFKRKDFTYSVTFKSVGEIHIFTFL